LHIVQEASSAVLALGLLSAWCACHYAESRAAHGILSVFFILIGLLHWIDYVRDQRPVTSGLVTSVPAVVFVVLWVLRRREERAGSRQAP
jgi:hypothetical protein